MGPGFWKIKSPIFGFDKNISLTRYSMHSNIFNSNNLSLDNRYVNLSLSSRDMFNKEIAIAWSENIYQNAVNHMKKYIIKKYKKIREWVWKYRKNTLHIIPETQN